MSRSSSRWVLSGAGLLAVLVVLVAIFSGPTAVPGTAQAVAAADLSRTALDQLDKFDNLRLQGSLETESGIELDVDIVALTGGGTTASVSDGAGGRADFVAVGDRVVVNANNAWWLNTVPVYASSLSGKWVQATENMGFPIGMLKVLSGKELRKAITGDEWSAVPTVYADGTPAVALTASKSPWTLYLASKGGRLLGIGGPLAKAGQKLRQPGSSAGSYPYALVNTTAVDDPCREQTGRTLTDAKQQAPTAPVAPPVPEPNHGPNVSVSIPPTGVCTTPTCPTPVVVQNAGDVAAEGTLMVSSTSGGGGATGVVVGPGQQVQQTFQVGNPASSCRQTCTVPYTVTAFVQVTSVAGPDLDTGKRLYDKGVDPNRPVPGKPGVAGDDVNKVIDGLTTPGPVVPGFRKSGLQEDSRVAQVVQLVADSGDQRLLSLLRTLARHPAIAVPADQPSPVVALARTAVKGKRVEQLAARQALSLLAQLVANDGRQPNSLGVENGLILDHQAKRIYSIAPVTNPENRAQRIYDTVDQAIKQFGTAGAGYSRVVVLDFGGSYPEYGQVQRGVLLEQLSKLKGINGKSLADLLRDGSGKPVISELMVANKVTRDSVPGARYVFTADDLQAFVHERPASMPTTKPTSGGLVYTQPNVRHIVEGDPYDPGSPGKQDTGGHLAEAGGPGKTEFPKAWTFEDVQEAIRQVVDKGNTIDGQGNPTGQPRSDVNHMNAEVWSWRYLGTATVKGVTVELDLYVYADGTVRNAYPALRAGGPNMVAGRETVHVNKTAPLTDATIFKNPDNPPASPKLNGARTAPPRYDRTTDTWKYPALDAKGNPRVDQSGKQITYGTDNDGNLVPGYPVPVPGC
jgi:hypothetical protein